MDNSIGLKRPRKPNFYDSAGLASRLLYGWAIPIAWNGFKREIVDEDIWEPMNQHRSDRCEKEGKIAWATELARAKRAKTRPSLARALIKQYGPRYLAMCLVLIILDFCSFLQVYFLYGLLEHFSGVESANCAPVKCAGGIVVMSFFRGTLLQTALTRSPFIGTSTAVAASTLLYQKVLQMSEANTSKISSGLIINLFGSDTKKSEKLYFAPAYLVLSPLQCILAGYFNWRLIGYAALPGAIFSLLYHPVQWWLSEKTSLLRKAVAQKSDARVLLMREIISGIKVIKMYAWEAPFAKLVSAARKEELNIIGKALTYRKIAIINFIYHNRFVLFVTLICYKIFDGKIDAVHVYAVTALINIYQNSLSFLMTKATVELGEALISLGRMTDFLVSDINFEEDAKVDSEPAEVVELNSGISPETESGVISIRSMTASWDDSGEPSLTDIDLTFPKGKLSAIVGPVGSGKSTLLSAILGELPIKSGTIRVPQRLAYAAQEPWVFQGTIIENIVFGQPMDDERYDQVLTVCGLNRDIASFPNGDKTLVGERGVMLSGGQRARIGLARAVYRKADAYLLDDPLSAVDINVGKYVFEKCIRGILKNETVILVTHQIQFLDSVENIVCMENGKVKSISSYMDLPEGEYSSKNQEEDSEYPLDGDFLNTNKFEGQRKTSEPEEMPPENELLKPVENIRAAYYAVNKGYWLAATVALIGIVTQCLASFFDLWLKHWVQVEMHVVRTKSNITNRLTHEDAPSIQWTPHIDWITEICMIVLTVTIGSLVISALIFVLSHMYFSIKVSTRLHDDMYNAVIRTSMYFFNNNTSGRILNRFSIELGTIDDVLSETGLQGAVLALCFLGGTFVIAIIDPWMIIPVALVSLACLGLREILERTSRSLKTIESHSRSPLLTHINQTVEGLKTIRAFGGQNFFTSEFYRYNDFSTSASFSTHAFSRAVAFWIDITGAICMAVVVANTYLTEGYLTEDAGLVLTQMMATAALIQYLMRNEVDFENLLTSVERVTEYAGLPSEAKWESEVPPSSDALGTWPHEGKIRFEDVSLRYRENGPKVLDNLNFTIMPREKIGIIGRTGAGKSSLVLALFRLAEVEGILEIDDIDTATVPLQTLRPKMSIIPQDPLLFSGTMRRNLDPCDKFSDDDLWAALEEVELKGVVSRMPNGLNTEILEGGGNLSVGQKQLVCLARALIGNNKILVLDEATANVDNETDAAIQRTIRRKFKANTVLTVAHRLHTVMDSDKVLVLSDGKVVEFDHPHVLFQDPNSHLTSLSQKCNESTVTTLRTLAEESYKKKIEGAVDSSSAK